jgi:hypothetical protein
MVAPRRLEVWDYDLENRLQAGHVYNDGRVFDQLCVFAPFEDWDEVLLCPPNELWSRFLVCSGHPDTKDKAMNRVDRWTNTIFDPVSHKILVIRMRATTGLRAPDTQGMNQFLVQLTQM